MAFTVRATGLGRASVDAAEVWRALSVLADPAAGVQIQSLPSGQWAVVPGGDLDAAVKAAERLSDGKGVYFSLNPCDPARTEPVKASAMLARRWLLVDLDVDRPPDTNATDAEHDAARDVGGKIMDWLTVQGWPEPVAIDSGNGWHLLYRVDLPNDKLSHSLLKRTLHALGDRFDTDKVKVDRKVYNANRISKLPGTLVRKGPLADDRPHRMARLVFVPDDIQIVDVAMLQAVAGLVTEPAAERPPVIPGRRPLSPFKLVGRGDDRTRTSTYAKKALRYEALRLRLATPGTRNSTANDAAFRCGTMVGAGWLMGQEVEAELLLAAFQCGLPAGEAADVIRRAMEAGREKPRADLPPNPSANGHAKAATPPGESGGADDPATLTVSAADIRPKKVEWLWPYRIAKRFIAILAGRTGVGKSFVTLDMVARITKGGEIPFGGGECFETGGALVVSEDPPEYMLVPRLIELGADLTKVRFMSWEAMAKYTLADVDYLDRAVREVPNCRVVVIDPPTNFLGETDEHKNAEVRSTLMRIVIWVKELDLAAILIMHVNKQTGKGIEALNRIMGSVAWVSTARIAHSFTPDPDDGDRSLFVCIKSNIGVLPKGLAYRLRPTDELAVVDWLEEVDVTADDAMNKEATKPRRRVVASEWLAEVFADASEVPSKVIWDAVKKTTVSECALKEAKDEMGIRARQICDDGGSRSWVWCWPDDARARWRPSAATDAEEF